MRMLSFTYETSLRLSAPVTDHSFVLRCLPRDTAGQKVLSAELITAPRIPLVEQIDGFGNRLMVGFCPQAHEVFDFFASGLVMVDSEDVAPREAHPMFLLPSEYAAADDAMKAYAASALEQAGLSEAVENPESVLARVQVLTEAVYNHFEYQPGATDTATTAAEAFAQSRGVCQDYAHVLIALCRACGIPAQYANGLMEGEGATHAWVQVHDGVHWRGVDPTHNRMTDDSYLLFSTGRDFLDCPIERGVFRGSAEQTQLVSASVGEGSGTALERMTRKAGANDSVATAVSSHIEGVALPNDAPTVPSGKWGCQ